MKTELWLPVVGYETHYDVSDEGRVRRTLGGRGATAGRVLRQHDQGGYLAVQLCRRDVKRKIAIHILVCEAFHGRRPRGKHVNHCNLDKHDNRASNLEWLTNRQNTLHAIRGGRKPGRRMPGTENGNARLSAEQVTEVRRQRGRIGQRVLAILCGVSKTAIQKIHQGRAWPEDLRVREYPDTRNRKRGIQELPLEVRP